MEYLEFYLGIKFELKIEIYTNFIYIFNPIWKYWKKMEYDFLEIGRKNSSKIGNFLCCQYFWQCLQNKILKAAGSN